MIRSNYAYFLCDSELFTGVNFASTILPINEPETDDIFKNVGLLTPEVVLRTPSYLLTGNKWKS